MATRITTQQVIALKRAAISDSPRAALMIHLSHWFALRVSEVCHIRLSDIRAGRITIRAVKGGLVREYALPESIEPLLARWLRERRPACSAFLFPHRTRRAAACSVDGAADLFERCFKAAGIEGASSHSLRHARATELAMTGANVYLLKSLLRHHSLASAQVYVDDADTAFLDTQLSHLG